MTNTLIDFWEYILSDYCWEKITRPLSSVELATSSCHHFNSRQAPIAISTADRPLSPF